jgi:hypothetical protein
VRSWRSRPTELCLIGGVVATAVYFALGRGGAQDVVYAIVVVGT